ncbi:MAG: FtsX-like permease family protein [Desulfobacterales bacterium]|nr:FtsX-like permease family protein [Desulfobacterales bacterium]
MTLKEIAIRNLVRRKGKAGFILAGLIIGVATVVAILSFMDAMTKDINHKLEKYGANILIVPKSENLPLTYGGLNLGGVAFAMEEIHESELDRIASIKNARNVAAVGPLVLGVVHVNTQKVLLAGVDFNAVRTLRPWWSIRGMAPDQNGILAGSEAARILGVEHDTVIPIKNQHLNLTGVLRPTGSQDDHLLFTRIDTAQAILDKQGQISMAEVAALCEACPITEMVRQISEAVPGAKVMAIQQVVKGRMDTLAQFKKFSYGISGVIVLIGGLVVLVTMMGSVRERTEEIGIFRAIGFRKRHVTHIVLMEAGIISGIAGILGYLLGLGAAQMALHFFSEATATVFSINLPLALGAISMAVTVGLISSAYPAIMASQMDPNSALRTL